MIVAVVPTARRADTLLPLVEYLLGGEGVQHVLVLDNGHGPGALDPLAADYPRVAVLDCRGLGIYAMWNAGVMLANQLGCEGDGDAVLLLNDDVRLAPGAPRALAGALADNPDALLAYPDYDAPEAPTDAYDPGGRPRRYLETRGTYKDGGMCGWAFALRASARARGVALDERFDWWCGDDDLARQVAAQGRAQVRVVGLWVGHESEGTASLPGFEWTHDAKGRDVERMRQKWGSW